MSNMVVNVNIVNNNSNRNSDGMTKVIQQSTQQTPFNMFLIET
jgi:hypothetical protein